MKQRVVIIHRWTSSPQGDWLPWLKGELEAKGYDVLVPAMPHTDTPTIDEWIEKLTHTVGEPDENTHFVGHSIGPQTIMRYLAQSRAKVGKLVFIAGWFTLFDLEDEEDNAIARPWITRPIDFAAVKKAAASITVFLSDDDYFVPLEENKKIFEEKLDAKVIVRHGRKHFADEDGITELPEVLELF